MAEAAKSGVTSRVGIRRVRREQTAAEALVAALSAHIGPEACICDEPGRRAFVAGNGRVALPSAVVQPRTVDALAAVIKSCERFGARWMVQGGGRCAGDAVGVTHRSVSGLWVLISTARLVRIDAPDMVARTVTVDAGVCLSDLAIVLAEAGASLGFELPDDEVATVGGILVSGAIGQAMRLDGGLVAQQTCHALAKRLVSVTGVQTDGTLAQFHASVAASGLPDLITTELSRTPPSFIVARAELAVTWHAAAEAVRAYMLPSASASSLLEWQGGHAQTGTSISLATRTVADAAATGLPGNPNRVGDTTLIAVLSVCDAESADDVIARFDDFCESSGGQPIDVARAPAKFGTKALQAALLRRARRTLFAYPEIAEIAPDGLLRAVVPADAISQAIDKLSRIATAELCALWMTAQITDAHLAVALTPLEAATSPARADARDVKRLRRGLARAVRALADLGGQVDIMPSGPRAYPLLDPDETALRPADPFDALAVADRVTHADSGVDDAMDAAGGRAASKRSLLAALRRS